MRAWSETTILPSSDGPDSGAPGSRGLDCVQRPHNPFIDAEMSMDFLPTASRGKAPFIAIRAVNAEPIFCGSARAAIRESRTVLRSLAVRRDAAGVFPSTYAQTTPFDIQPHRAYVAAMQLARVTHHHALHHHGPTGRG